MDLYQAHNQLSSDGYRFGSAYSDLTPDPVQQLDKKLDKILDKIQSLENQVTLLGNQLNETNLNAGTSSGMGINYATPNMYDEISDNGMTRHNLIQMDRAVRVKTSDTSDGHCNVVLVGKIPMNMSNPDAVYYMFSRFGIVERIKILKNPSIAMVQFQTPEMANMAVNGQDSLNKIGSGVYVKFCNNVPEIELPKDITFDGGRTKDFTKVPVLPHLNLDGTVGRNLGPCIYLSRLPEELADPDMLFNIFSNYGDVHRVKILYNKPDCAIIQMAKPHQATLCCRYLDHTKIGGSIISVRNSEIPQVNLSEDKDDDKTKDYSRSKMHRFFNPKYAEKLMNKMVEPTTVLFISNLPEGKLDSLKKYVIESGFTVKNIEYTGKVDDTVKVKSSMALVELSTVEEAIMAIGKLHNTMPEDIGEKKDDRGLCISFSNFWRHRSKAE